MYRTNNFEPCKYVITKFYCNLLSTGAGPIADKSGPCSEKNSESWEALRITGVDDWQLKLELEAGVKIFDVRFSVLV